MKRYTLLLVTASLLLVACEDPSVQQRLDRIERKVDETAKIAIMQRYKELDDIASENLDYSFMNDPSCSSFERMFEVTGQGIFELREKAAGLGYLDVVKDIDEMTQLTLNVTNAKCKKNVLIWDPNVYNH